MINRKFNGPSGRATKFSHPRATMSIIVVMFIAEPLIRLRPFVQSDCWTLGLQTTDGNKISEACGCSLLRPRRVSTSRSGALGVEMRAGFGRLRDHGVSGSEQRNA